MRATRTNYSGPTQNMTVLIKGLLNGERERERLSAALPNASETALHRRLRASLKLHRSVSTVNVTKKRRSSFTGSHTHTQTLCLRRSVSLALPSTPANTHTNTHRHAHFIGSPLNNSPYLITRALAHTSMHDTVPSRRSICVK